MVFISKDDFIWIEATNSPIGVLAAPIGARVISAAGDKILVIDDNGIERKLSTDKRIRVMHPTSIQSAENLIQLSDLHEAAIIRNLHIRFCEKLIYTYCGSMLIAFNPYKKLAIYSTDQINLYKDHRNGALPPHIFAIASNALSNISQQRISVQDQCIIISGESGTGKTENAKLIVQYLANVTRKSNSAKNQMSCIEQQIVDANQIFEAFGNAKSIHNNNSSRFGKFIDLQFNIQTGSIAAAQFEHFLLEKSRIVLQLPEERNFHIFYSLLKGLNPAEKFEFELGNAGDYHILIQNRSQCLDDLYRNIPELSEICKAMKVLMFKDAEINAIFKVLAALLHIGNLKYQVHTDENGEKADICDMLNVGRICKLLQIEANNLTNAFCKQSNVLRGEHVVTNLNTVQALNLRDAFIKGVYSKIFDYIVRRINDAIYRPCSVPSNDMNNNETLQKTSSIGVLDFFGFEDVGSFRNSFEQLCINYASEHLQQYHIRQVFKLEQDEYESQHIVWNRIEFEAFDNLSTLEMLAVQPLNIFSLLNDESLIPQATNQTLLKKLHSTNEHNESCYIKPKSELSKFFGVNHYAGPVFYQINGFIEKNRDHFSANLLSLIESSRFRFLNRLFENGTNYLSKKDNGYGAISKDCQTVSLRFCRLLESLMNRLEVRQPLFVHCIKSNDTKKPMYFDRNLVTKQLQYSGVLEATFIFKAGFSVRIDYAIFVNCYRVFLPGSAPTEKIDNVQAARHICANVLGPETDYQFGKTKVFLKKEHELILQNELKKILMHYSVILQKTIRGWIQCRRFKCLRTAAIVLQKNWRAYIQKNKYKKVLLGISRLQAFFRSYQLISHYDHLKFVITQFQACCRGAVLRGILRLACFQHDCRAAMLLRIKDDDINSIQIDNEKDCFNDDVNNNCLYEPKLKPDKSSKEDYSIYQFDKFAATHFQNQINEKFACKPIYYPLLQHENISDRMASISIWICLLKFMNDLPANNSEESLQREAYRETSQEKEKESMMTIILTAQKKNYAQADYEKLLKIFAQFNTSTKNPMFKPENSTNDLCKNDSSKSKIHLDYNNQKNDSYNFYYNFISNLKAKSNFELIHFIIAHGIVNKTLRDEIYCQICKQLNGNKSRFSLERGWILLALCAGCFAPTHKFFKYLKCYLQDNCLSHVKNYNLFVNTRLDRTMENGARRQPPSRIELEACKSKKPIELTIAFMNDSVCTVIGDSASNSLEICSQLSQKIGLVTVNSKNNDGDFFCSEESAFGFSLYIVFCNKVSSMGAGSDHVFDAISQSEKMNNKMNWRLFFRKEIFAPWHNSSLNSVSTNLIYEQIVRGVRFGEYPCDKDEDLVLICSQRYFIDRGAINMIDVSDLSNQLFNYLPEAQLLKGDAHLNTEKWLQLVLNTFRKKFVNGKKVNVDLVKEKIVLFAMHKWPLFFSRFYNAFKFMGPPLLSNEVVIAVNSAGLTILNNEDQKLVDYSFPEIARVSCSKSERIGADTVTFQFVNGDNCIFQSSNAEDICNLVEYFLKGLQKRSKYLLAMRPINSIIQENDHTSQTSILNCDKGDLLILTNDQTGETVAKENLVFVENTRNGLHGFVPTNSVYIFPILTKPSVDLVEMFHHHDPEPIYNFSAEQQLLNCFNALLPYFHNIHSIYRPHTLQQFAVDNFHEPSKLQSAANLDPKIECLSIQNDLKKKSIQKESVHHCSIFHLPPNHNNIMPLVSPPPLHIYGHNDLWRWSPNFIKRPLLKRIDGIMEAPSVEAAFGYKYILKYMGDFPTQRPKYFLEFTDIIFRAPLKYKILHDEVYCQLMKQLTDNPNPLSEERGWELMWLCLGLFPPSVGLEKELSQFLKSRFLPIAADCVIRLQKIVKVGGMRKFPPHQVEVEAIQHKTTQIFHKVFFPNGSEEEIEVDSLTNARNFAARIVARLHLKSGVGFSIFVKVGEKVISMPENEYLFDFIHQLADWMLHNRAHLKQTNHRQIFSYQIFFMRKLWINVTPGDDPNADSIFHYYQELPKYLRGYHNVTRQQAVKIAAIILRAQTQDDKNPPFQQFQHIVQEILPRDLRKAHSTSEWKKLIIAEFETLNIQNSAAGKLEFLKYISQFPTFGSAFFEVKPSDPTLAPRIVVAINQNGINLFNQDNKEHIVSYPFTAINNWMSGNTYFHLTLGSLIKGNRLLFETTLGYKMDDLLTSYIQILLSAIDNSQKTVRYKQIC